ncbi:hypothetical protein N799_07055 [Lysobacter arseniciresistens ZS79]|uniref:Translational regulator CsrA n=1 Tax=Lysobacter arseniciresistens ZS79 TaxID=913325 RepID=A0A0A0EWH4_9GAMM|nr:carbon storage regulator [Lysobacter arseniciresistens]KGM55336.1 hypothetical protein N799_07055 [Lysobacter arseniciresistens ZS79]
MLLLTRREAGVVSVGSSVRVTVRSVRDGQVKFGIAAPRDVPVYRGEIRRRMQCGASQASRDGA